MVLELTSKGSWRVLDTMGEINMDDPKVLEDFVVKAIKRHPAEKYALDLWNHGAGIAGFGGDYSSKKNDLSIIEILNAAKSGLERTGVIHFDIVGWDACLMSAYTVARTFALYLIINYFLRNLSLVTAGITLVHILSLGILSATLQAFWMRSCLFVITKEKPRCL